MASSSRANPAGAGNAAPVVLFIGILAVCLLLAFSLSYTSSFYVLGGLIGFLVLAISFFSPEFGVSLLIVSMLLSPEFGAGAAGSGGNVEGSRSVVIRLDDILLVILSVSWFARTAIHKELGLIVSNSLNRPIAVYVLSCFISTIIGYMNGNVTGKIGIFFVIRYIEYFVVFFIALNVLDSPKKMHRFMKIAFFTSIAIALYGMWQIPSGVRVSAPFEGETGEPNTMGGYLVLMMCMAAGQALTARTWRAVVGWCSYLFFLLIPVLFTGSRSSWLAIPAAMLALFIFSPKRKQIGAIAVVLMVIGPALLPGSVKDRLLFTFQQEKQTRSKVKQIEVGGVRLDTSTSARLESYSVAFKGWKEKPLIGWGITGYVFIDSQFVRTMAELGLLGLGAFFWLTWAYLQGGLAALRACSDRFQFGIALGYLAALFALVAHSTGSNTFIILRIMEPWMVFTAFVFRIPMLQADRDKRWAETDLKWVEDPHEEEAPVPEGPAAKPLLKIGREGGITLIEPDAGEKKDGGSAQSSRFRRFLSQHEKFLRREALEVLRREREAAEIRTAAPEFRKRARREAASSAHGAAATALATTPVRVPVRPGAPPARTSGGPPPEEQSPPSGAPPQTRRASPARAVELARGIKVRGRDRPE